MICIIRESNWFFFVLRDRFITKFLKSKTQIGFILRINFNKIFAMKTRLFKLKVIAYTQ